MTPLTIDSIRNCRPTTRDHLHHWTEGFTGVRIARRAVCVGHHAPFDAYAAKCLDCPPITLELGSRGSGKSFIEALTLHYTSRFLARHKSRILGGSEAQSRQIYEALQSHVQDGHGDLGSDGDTIESLQVKQARYRNASHVAILAASSRSVRGPHVPTLALDEVDEIEPDIREAAMGMNMGVGDVNASLHMTSTWHRTAGPMASLIEQARGGAFPLFIYCVFEVLERCSTSRSGSHLEKCPECPLMKWCHEDRFADPTRPPKAKISDGHYRIDDLIQKVRTTSKRVFEADYLCKGPKANGIWFPQFDRAKHVTAAAEYDPNLNVYLGIDIGNRTGAVFFQVREMPGNNHRITAFADFYADNAVSAEAVAREILEVARVRCNGKLARVTHDPAGLAKTAVGPAVITEYKRAGFGPMSGWPMARVLDSLALLEAFVMDASDTPWLAIHPRCKHLIDAFEGYRRGGKAPQWSEMPADPQHPAEDMIDALRGGLYDRFPDGRKGQRPGRKVGRYGFST